MERKTQLSRRMLEVAIAHRFPVSFLERSPLITRDKDLLVEAARVSYAGGMFSIGTADPAVKHAFEPKSPGVKRRLKAMAELAAAGLPVGVSMMPIIPLVGDSPHQLEELIRAIADHGGTFVLASGLTMAGKQARRTLAAAERMQRGLGGELAALYGASRPVSGDDEGLVKLGESLSHGPRSGYARRVSLTVRELCTKHGIADRMPRPRWPGIREDNHLVAERLFLKTYDLDLEGASPSRLWAYRRAAWTVDELDESLFERYRRGGQAALRELPGIGERLGALIARWLDEEFPPKASELGPPGSTAGAQAGWRG